MNDNISFEEFKHQVLIDYRIACSIRKINLMFLKNKLSGLYNLSTCDILLSVILKHTQILNILNTNKNNILSVFHNKKISIYDYFYSAFHLSLLNHKTNFKLSISDQISDYIINYLTIDKENKNVNLSLINYSDLKTNELQNIINLFSANKTPLAITINCFDSDIDNIKNILSAYDKKISIYNSNSTDYTTLCSTFEKGLNKCFNQKDIAVFIISNTKNNENEISELTENNQFRGVSEMRNWIIENNIADIIDIQKIELEINNDIQNSYKKAFKDFCYLTANKYNELFNFFIKNQKYFSKAQINYLIGIDKLLKNNDNFYFSNVNLFIDNLKKFVTNNISKDSKILTVFKDLFPQLLKYNKFINTNKNVILNNLVDKTFLNTKPKEFFNSFVSKLKENYSNLIFTEISKKNNLSVLSINTDKIININQNNSNTDFSDLISSFAYNSTVICKVPDISYINLVNTKKHNIIYIIENNNPLLSAELLNNEYFCISFPNEIKQMLLNINYFVANNYNAIIFEPNISSKKEDYSFKKSDFEKLSLNKIIIPGTDISLVTYANNIKFAIDTAKFLGSLNIGVEIININSILPFDNLDLILNSIKKTNNLVVLDIYNNKYLGDFIINKIISNQNFLPVNFKYRNISNYTIKYSDNLDITDFIAGEIKKIIDNK